MASQIYPFDNFRIKKEMDPALCFIISPFKKEFAGPRQAIEDVAVELSLKCVRADDIRASGVIHADIWDFIQKAGVIIADITEANPNVMLELGAATAIKEHFRVILIIRRELSDSIPFDLSPFRHIRYEDTMIGSRELKAQIKEYVRKAISEEGITSSVQVRMEEWEKSSRHYSLLPYEDTLARFRGFANIERISKPILAYLLAGAIQNGTDLEWWTQVNKDNPYAAEVAVELILGPWLRPQFRAAYVLQHLPDQLMNTGVEEGRRLSTMPIVNKLLDAVQNRSVVSFTQNEATGLINESERYELLQNFFPRKRVHLSIS